MDEQQLWSVRFWTLAAALILAFAVLMFALSHHKKVVGEPLMQLTRQNDSSVDTADDVNSDAGADAVGIIGPVTNEPIAAPLPPDYAIPLHQASDDWPAPDPNPLSFLPPLPGFVPMPTAG